MIWLRAVENVEMEKEKLSYTLISEANEDGSGDLHSTERPKGRKLPIIWKQ